MGLTIGGGPLAAKIPKETNFELRAPERKLFLHRFPRRVRALFGGETILDTTRGGLLHETDELPKLYVPDDDVRQDLLVPTDHRTHCPFKGEASYWSVRISDHRLAENAAWSYPDPLPEAEWLRGRLAFYFDALDEWFDEDERVEGHLRDPYHRVDVRASSRKVRVRVDGHVVAESERPKVLSETGLPNRYYVPAEDVRGELLGPSQTHTVCPYKGSAEYRSLEVDGQRVDDAVWIYPKPLEDALKIRDHLCFDPEKVELEVERDPLG